MKCNVSSWTNGCFLFHQITSFFKEPKYELEKREHFKIDDIVRWVLVGIISREDAYTNMSISSIGLEQPVTSLESWSTIVKEAKLREAWKLEVVLSIDQIVKEKCCLWENEKPRRS